MKTYEHEIQVTMTVRFNSRHEDSADAIESDHCEVSGKLNSALEKITCTPEKLSHSADVLEVIEYQD